ncbi:MAG: UbiD family decarboxylase, partial [candidate division Zixibacteria bacterium]|nr:UbiD family decarboxylase [candidate division Zixibacteria bacterium]
ASGACQDVVMRGDEIDLYKLGVIQCWPKDSGRFLTMPQCFTKNPQTGVQNCGMYRLQIYDKKTTGMHIHMHHDGAFNARKYSSSGGRVELACAIGGDPACAYAATAPLPPGMDEMLVAGFIRKKAVRMVKCKTIDIHVPAEADIVIEGYVDINEFRTEGPFGDHTGVYSLADEFPVYHVTAITHRKNPVYQTIIVGVPPQEDYYLGKATERMFLPLLKTQMPELLDMNMPIYGNFHNFMFVQIKKEYPHHARKIMNQIWGTGQMMFSKYIVVVDENTDVQSSDAVWAQIARNVDFAQDIEITKGPVDILDHAGEAVGIGAKMGVDATSRLTSEGPARKTAAIAQLEKSRLESLVKQIDELIEISQPDFDGTHRFLFVKVEKRAAFDAFKVMKRIRESEPALAECHIVAIDGATDVTDPDAVFFRWGNNVDPKRDIRLIESDNGITCLSVDATRHRLDEGYTREWPEDIVMTDKIKKRVNEKWEKFIE